jgi:hypothetical protein
MVGLAPLDIVYRDGASTSSSPTTPLLTSKKVVFPDEDADDADRHPAHTNNTSPYYKCILSPYLRFREGALTVDEEAKSVLAYCVYAAVMHGIVPLHRIVTNHRRDHHGEEDICSSFGRSEMVLSSLFHAPYHSCGVVMDPATMLHSHRIQDGKQRMEFYPFIQRRGVHGSLVQFLSGVCRDSTDNTTPARTTAATLTFADASSSAHIATSRIASLMSRANKAVLYECASTAAIALYDVVGPSASSRPHVRRSVVSTVTRCSWGLVSGLSWGAIVGVWTCLRLCIRLIKAVLVDAPTYTITSLLRTSPSSHPTTNADDRERDLIKTIVGGGCPSSILKRWAVSYCTPSPVDLQDNLAADVPALFDLHEDAAHSMEVGDALLDAALSYYSHSLPRLVRLCALPFLLPSSSNDCTPVLGAMATPAFLVKASSKYVMEVLLEIDVLMYVGTDRSSWRDPTWPRRKLLFSDDESSIAHKKSSIDRVPPARVAASTVSELLALGGSYLPGRDVARIEGRIGTMLNTPNTTTVEVNEEGVQFAENSFREHQVAAYIKEESGG